MNDPDHYYYSTLPLLLQRFGMSLARPLFKFFLRLDVRGTVEGTGPYIFAVNHASELDPVVAPLVLPIRSPLLPLYFVANPKEKYTHFGWRKFLYGGTFFNMLGAYSIHSGKRDYAYSLSDHEALLRKGKSVLIFPEGRRTRDGHFSPAHGGMAYLAHTTATSVVPIAIDSFFGMSFFDFLFRRRRVRVTVGTPILAKVLVPMEHPTVDDFRAAGEKVMASIGEMFRNKQITISKLQTISNTEIQITKNSARI